MDSKKKMGFGIGVMVIRDGKVLLGKRHDNPEKADSLMHGEGTWTMPGGKVDFGESFEDAAYREAFEETGIRIDKSKLKLISVTNDIVHDAHFVTLGILCKGFDGEPQVMEPDEITGWEWFHLDGLPKPLFFPCEKILKNYLSGEIYKH
ncbi:MAG: NUDIX domain-containing protein [Candidatus Aenigmarchaeota archaeon]|nr:NUDIX domain-containing protein [Candidatus Aenigmarchaeota archaeon]